jgi:hypothetical protein
LEDDEKETELIFDDTHFTPAELKLLSTNAEKLKSELNTVKELPADRLKALEEKVDELVQMAKESKTITKIKWKELFINSFLGFLIRSAVPQETFNKIMGIVFKGIKILIQASTGQAIF